MRRSELLVEACPVARRGTSGRQRFPAAQSWERGGRPGGAKAQQKRPPPHLSETTEGRKRLTRSPSSAKVLDCVDHWTIVLSNHVLIDDSSEPHLYGLIVWVFTPLSDGSAFRGAIPFSTG